MNAVRPTSGYVIRQNGDRIEVRFVPDPERDGVFIPLRVDGKDLVLYPGDSMGADVLGPGQSISVPFEEGNR